MGDEAERAPMAWMAKQSGSARVERREEPYLTAAMRRELAETHVPRYPVKQACTLPALHMVQHAYGWVPMQAMEEIAEFLGLKPADVLDTASFYEEYWLKPRGRHLVAVCRSIACEVCGHRGVTEACKAALGIEVGETTGDGKFTLIEIECLGSCGTAPAMLVDDVLHENVRGEGVRGILAGVKDGGGGH